MMTPRNVQRVHLNLASTIGALIFYNAYLASNEVARKSMAAKKARLGRRQQR
jgi:hypothetical protein